MTDKFDFRKLLTPAHADLKRVIDEAQTTAFEELRERRGRRYIEMKKRVLDPRLGIVIQYYLLRETTPAEFTNGLRNYILRGVTPWEGQKQ